MVDGNFSTALTAIYEAATAPNLWPHALTTIANCFGDYGAILLYNRDDGGYDAISSPNLEGCLAKYIGDGWNFRDIRAIRSREFGYFSARDVITDRDVVSDQEIEKDPFYTDFLAPHGLKYFAAAMVSPNPHVEVAISLQRGIDKPPYSEAEIELLRSLGQHVEQALRLSVRLLDADLMAGGLIDAFNRINVGIFVLDSLRRVLFSNSLASELIGDGFEVVDGGLQLTHVKGPAEHSEILSNPIGHPPGPFQTRPVLVNRRSTQRPSIAYLIPLKSSQAAAFLARANTIVLIINPDEAVAPDPSLLRDILGITLGEARVASLVGTGWPPKETAKKLGIADETVRTVLKRVYAKVGVSRQSELSGLIARLRIGDAAGPQA